MARQRILVGLLMWLVTPAMGSAQQQSGPDSASVAAGVLRARIDYLAGTTIYVNAGEGLGIEAGDTFAIADRDESLPVSLLEVISVAGDRSVLGFVSRPVPLTRGQQLVLEPTGASRDRLLALWAPGAGEQPAVVTAHRTPEAPVAAVATAAPTVRGRAYVEMSAMRSTTSWNGEGIQPGDLSRTFATPSLRLNASASDLPGGIRLSTSVRTAYRYSEPSLVRASTIRVYELALEKQTTWGEVRLGRFFNPYESYSGYWDGALIRLGGQGIGAGALVGFQPDRWNEGFSSETAKLTGFVDYRLTRDASSWSGDVSFHRAESDVGLPTHTFVGWSQDVRLGSIRLSQDIQVDEDPETGAWVVSRAQGGGTWSLTDELYVHGRYSRRRPYSVYREVDVFSSVRDHAGLGLGYSGGWGSVSADLGRGTVEGIGRSWNASGSVALRRPRGLGVDLGSAISYWVRDDYRVLSVSPSVTRLFGRVRGRLTYRYHVSRSVLADLGSQGLDLTLSVPLRPGWTWTVQGNGRWGDTLHSYRVHTGLSLGF